MLKKKKEKRKKEKKTKAWEGKRECWFRREILKNRSGQIFLIFKQSAEWRWWATGISGRKLRERLRSVSQDMSLGALEFALSLPGPVLSCSVSFAASIFFTALTSLVIKFRHYYVFPWSCWEGLKDLGWACRMSPEVTPQSCGMLGGGHCQGSWEPVPQARSTHVEICTSKRMILLQVP